MSINIPTNCFYRPHFPKSEDQDFWVECNVTKPLTYTNDYTKHMHHVKRVLKEMADSHKTVKLGFSGGQDSGFILCCLRDLIRDEKFDKIEVIYGKFMINGVHIAIDYQRVKRFVDLLGIPLREIDFELSEEVVEKAENTGKPYFIGESVALLQETFRRSIDAMVIKGDCHLGLNNKRRNGKFETASENFLHHTAGSNSLEMYDWDEDMFCSYMTHYFMFREHIDMSPFTEEQMKPGNPMNPYTFDGSLYRWMIHLYNYPELGMLLYKIPTFRTSEVMKGPGYLKDFFSLTYGSIRFGCQMGFLRFYNGEQLTPSHFIMDTTR